MLSWTPRSTQPSRPLLKSAVSELVCRFAKLVLNVLLAVNGRGVDLLKAGSKRRRTKAEMEEFKFDEIRKADEEQDMRRRISLLEQKLVNERNEVI